MFVFHIGLHKTGTSTVQAFLAANRAALAHRGILFPAIAGAPAAQHALGRDLREGEGIGSPAWAELRALAPAARGAAVVVSSEGLGGCDPGMVRRGIDGAEAQVLVYLREPFRWVASTFAQRAKRGATTDPFDAHFARHRRRLAAWADRILPWAEAFGPERVRVRLLDPASLAGGTLIDDLLDALGTTARGLAPVPDANESPDWRVVELLRERHARHQAEVGGRWSKRDRLPQRIAEAGAAAGARLGWRDRADYLTAEQKAFLRDRFAADRLRLLAALPDCRIPDLALDAARGRPFTPGPEAVPAQDRAAFDAAFAAAWLERRRQGAPGMGAPGMVGGEGLEPPTSSV